MLFLAKEEDIITNQLICALYFYAPWMPYHPKFITMISKIEDKNLPFFAIDTDQFSSQCKRFNITSIPTVLILKEGKEIKRINGLVLTSVFKSAFADI